MIRIKQNKICFGDYDFLTFFDRNIGSVSPVGSVFLECSDDNLKVYFNYSEEETTYWMLIEIQLGTSVVSSYRFEKCPNPEEYIETSRIIIPYFWEILLKGYVSTNESIKFQYEDLRFFFIGSLKESYFRTERFEMNTTFEEFIIEMCNSFNEQYKSLEDDIHMLTEEGVLRALNEKKIIYNKEFEKINKVRILRIPRSIQTIEIDGLCKMKNVKAVLFENNTSLNKLSSVLNHCDMVQVLVFHEGLEQLSWSGNYCKELQQVKLPKSLRVLRNCFIDSQKLEEIFIPCNVRFVGNFCSCEGLKIISVDHNNQKYTSYDGCLYSKDLKTLYSCPPSKESISIPEETEIIAEYALNNCSKLRNIKLPKGLKEIQQYSFVRTKFSRKEIDIPLETVVDSWAFEN